MLKTIRSALSSSALKSVRRFSSLKEDVAPENLRRTPVLLEESIDALGIEEGETYVDMTFGTGDQSRAMLEQGARVIAIDRDPTVTEQTEKLKEEFKDNFDFRVSKIADVREVLSSCGVRMGSVSGVLIRCGYSSVQMDQPRGFSTSVDAPLDMRLNPAEKDSPTAAALVNVLDGESLSRIIKVYGGEKKARAIADAIVSYRYEMNRIRTTGQLANIIEAALGEGRKDSPARFMNPLFTKTLMALRIFVNDELNELNRGLYLCQQMLRPGGYAAVVSTHSLEDRLVKRHFLGIDLDEPASVSVSQKYKNSTAWHSETELVKTWIPVGPKFIAPTADEIERNPKCRSTKLRVAEKCGPDSS